MSGPAQEAVNTKSEDEFRAIGFENEVPFQRENITFPAAVPQTTIGSPPLSTTIRGCRFPNMFVDMDTGVVHVTLCPAAVSEYRHAAIIIRFFIIEIYLSKIVNYNMCSTCLRAAAHMVRHMQLAFATILKKASVTIF
jgi:hypothetical protein